MNRELRELIISLLQRKKLNPKIAIILILILITISFSALYLK